VYPETNQRPQIGKRFSQLPHLGNYACDIAGGHVKPNPADVRSMGHVGQFHNKTINRDVWLEDFSTLEKTWKVLRSGAKHNLNLQDGEFMVRNFNEMADAKIV
jgi:hypothetical protein